MTILAYIFTFILGFLVLGFTGIMFYFTIKFDMEEKKAQKLKESING